MTKELDELVSKWINLLENGRDALASLKYNELLKTLLENYDSWGPEQLYNVESKLNDIYKTVENTYLKKDINLILSFIAECGKNNSALLNLCEERIGFEEIIGDLNEIAGAHEAMALLQKRLGNLTEVEKHRYVALELYSKLNNKKGMADQKIAIGNFFKEKGDSKSALLLYEEANVLCRDANYLHGRIIALCNMGDAFREIGQIQVAMNILFEALQLCNETDKERASRIPILRYLAWCHEDLNQFNEAIECLRESYDLADKKSDPEVKAHLLGDQGNLCQRAGNYHEALNFNMQALKEYSDLGNLQGQADRLANIGRIYINLDNPIGVDFLEQALTINRRIGNRHEEALLLSSLGSYYLHILDLEKAIGYLMESIDLLRLLSIHDITFSTIFYLGKVYEMLNNNELAWQMYEESINELNFLRNQIFQEDSKMSFLGEDKVQFYEHVIMFLINKKKDIVRAFEYIERSKSRALIEQMGYTDLPSPRNISCEHLQKERESLIEIRDATIAIRNTTKDADRQGLSMKITAARRNLDYLLEEMKNADPEYVSLRRGIPITFKEIKEILCNV